MNCLQTQNEAQLSGTRKHFCFRASKNELGTFPVAPAAKTPCSHGRGPGSVPGQGTRSHTPQLRVHMPQLKIRHAETKKSHK